VRSTVPVSGGRSPLTFGDSERTMPIEKRDEEYGYRTLIRVFALIFSLMFVGVFIIPTAVTPGHFTPAGYVVAAIWIIVLVVGTIWCARVRATYRCPGCGASLPPLKSEKSTDYEHRFLCECCDIVWTTGVHEGDS
jgi:hypothetical protein